MSIVDHEECIDNVISYQFHVQSCLGIVFDGWNQLYACLVVSIPEVTFVPKMIFLRKEKFFTIYLRNNIRFPFTILTAVCCGKRILS